MNRKIKALLCILGLALGFLVATAPQASASLSVTDIRYGGGWGYANIYVAKGWNTVTPDSSGRPVTQEIFQTDCNDVIKRLNANGTTTIIWASNTVRPTNTDCSMVFQQDGNKVIYQAGHGAIFATGTNRGLYGKYIAEVQSDGTAMISWFDPSYGWRIIWLKG